MLRKTTKSSDSSLAEIPLMKARIMKQIISFSLVIYFIFSNQNLLTFSFTLIALFEFRKFNQNVGLIPPFLTFNSKVGVEHTPAIFKLNEFYRVAGSTLLRQISGNGHEERYNADGNSIICTQTTRAYINQLYTYSKVQYFSLIVVFIASYSIFTKIICQNF